MEEKCATRSLEEGRKTEETELYSMFIPFPPLLGGVLAKKVNLEEVEGHQMTTLQTWTPEFYGQWPRD